MINKIEKEKIIEFFKKEIDNIDLFCRSVDGVSPIYGTEDVKNLFINIIKKYYNEEFNK